jgi:hypothetical protein
MGMMTQARRRLALVLFAALAIPAAAMPFLPVRTVSQAENRSLARPPAWPSTLEEWRTAPRAIDAFVADHFGFREPLLHAGAALRETLGGQAASAKAVAGKSGWMFLTEGLLRSTGQEVDPARAADYAAFVCEAAGRLKAGGAQVAFSLAPSPAGIYPEAAPDWAGPAKRPTEYDLVLAGVRRCGVEAVDLRPVMVAAKGAGQAYRRLDSHWTLRGSLAAYDSLVEAFDRPDWRIDPASLRWGFADLDNGDLPRLAGQDARVEHVEIHDRTALPPGARKTPLAGLTYAAAQPFLVETGKPGPTVLIVGDSFTADPLPPYFAPFAGRVAWAHQDKCRFDWRIVDRVKPDYVLILPAEREAVCDGARPEGFPALAK